MPAKKAATKAKAPARKTAKKTAKPKPALVPQPDGRGALLTGGVPGNKGGTGRPPNEHIEWCRQAITDPTCEAAVLAVLQDRTHPAFATMWKTMAERGYGKPVQPVEHAGANGGAIAHALTVRFVAPAAPDGHHG